MYEQAMQFAEEYRLNAERLNARVREPLRHPLLYVFAGECGDAYAHIHTHIHETLSGGAFFLTLSDSSDSSFATAKTAKDIRAIKTEIQRNEAGLNVKRVDIHVIVQASGVQTSAAEQAGQLLKDIFDEDVPVTHMTLFILLSESNRYEDYEQRSVRSLKTLQAAMDTGTLYDIIYLLSDRNENDVVSDGNMLKNYELIGDLHALAQTESRFEDSLRRHQDGKPCFATAGFSRMEKPHKAIAYAVFTHVYNYLLAELQKDSACYNKPQGLTGPQGIDTSDGLDVSVLDALADEICARQSSDTISGEKIIRDLASVATKKAGLLALRGHTLREIENILYGEGAERFFEANYGETDYTQAVREVFARLVEQAHKGPYWFAAYKTGKPDALFNAMQKQIVDCEQEIASRYGETLGLSFINGLETARKRIAAVYALRCKRQRILDNLNICRKLDALFSTYAKRCAEFTAALENASAELTRIGDPGHHITQYYKQVVLGIMAELETQHGERFILKDAFVGPGSVPPPDVVVDASVTYISATADRIAAFIRAYVFTHETMNLSFDEDLKRRAQTAPDEYDREFTHIDEFYRRLLHDAEQQAALAVSLQRYDDLTYEKYYFGDTSGALMRYVHRYAGERAGEAVYFLENEFGFKLVRLAGGFTAENLTRYRVMQSYSQHSEV